MTGHDCPLLTAILAHDVADGDTPVAVQAGTGAESLVWGRHLTAIRAFAAAERLSRLGREAEARPLFACAAKLHTALLCGSEVVHNRRTLERLAVFAASLWHRAARPRAVHELTAYLLAQGALSIEARGELADLHAHAVDTLRREAAVAITVPYLVAISPLWVAAACVLGGLSFCLTSCLMLLAGLLAAALIAALAARTRARAAEVDALIFGREGSE